MPTRRVLTQHRERVCDGVSAELVVDVARVLAGVLASHARYLQRAFG